MAFTAPAETPPLREDGTGALRVGDSRVFVDVVLRAFQDGATPETILERYPTLSLADIYAVITYYLRHRNEVEAYLEWREQKAHETSARVERTQSDWGEVRSRLMARRGA